MSSIFYIASDKPLPKRENPHEKLLSVREALALGITDLPAFLLAKDFDQDKPNVILSADREIFPRADGTIDDGGFPNDFAIDPLEKDSSMQTAKPYCAQVQWRFTAKRAERLIEYLKERLEETESLELWHGWLDGSAIHPVRKKEISIHALTTTDIAALEEADTGTEPCIHFCLSIQKAPL